MQYQNNVKDLMGGKQGDQFHVLSGTDLQNFQTAQVRQVANARAGRPKKRPALVLKDNPALEPKSNQAYIEVLILTL